VPMPQARPKRTLKTREQIERDRAAALDAALKKENQARRDADLATRHARRLAVVATLVALIAVIAFGAALLGQAVAQAAKERAVASKNAANDLINFMQYDLRDTLGKPGQLRMMEHINARIRRYHEEHPVEAGDTAARDAADRERSVALDQQGDILFAQGDLAGALKSYRDSLANPRAVRQVGPRQRCLAEQLGLEPILYCTGSTTDRGRRSKTKQGVWLLKASTS
jgi:hypothetical protein